MHLLNIRAGSYIGYEIAVDGSPWAPRANVLFAHSSNPRSTKAISGELHNRSHHDVRFQIRSVCKIDTAPTLSTVTAATVGLVDQLGKMVMLVTVTAFWR